MLRLSGLRPPLGLAVSEPGEGFVSAAKLLESTNQLGHLVHLDGPVQTLKGLARGSEDFQGASRVDRRELSSIDLTDGGDVGDAIDPADQVPGFGEPLQGL